jgi:hypothetical protein
MKPRNQSLAAKALLAITLIFPVLAQAGQLGFSTMEDGDRVEIISASKGCFHDTTAWYVIRRDKGACVLTEYKITWGKSGPPKIAEKKIVGELTLTKDDLVRLDGLLSFYRGKKEASSTTQDSLFIEYYEGERRVGGEKLQDESGGYGLEARKDVVTFFELTTRFQK